MTDDERKLVVELCGQLSIAVTICRMDTGAFRPDESIKSWEASVKRGLAAAGESSGADYCETDEVAEFLRREDNESDGER